MPSTKNSPRKLILRLSSLGDVILATAALECARDGTLFDWVVAKEFASLLEGHPRIGRLWKFDRKTGLRGWLSLCDELWKQKYDEVIDLHVTLRSRLVWAVFRSHGVISGRWPRWYRVSKERFRHWGLFTFKGIWPRTWLPHKITAKMALAVGGSGQERPDLRHLLQLNSVVGDESGLERELRSWQKGLKLEDRRKPWLAVMPSSRWAGKNWPADRYAQVLKDGRFLPIVLGSSGDRPSLALVEALRAQGLVFYSAVGRWELPEVARVLAKCAGLLGNDTGLAHLAEAVGTPAMIIYGPTTPEVGFGPSDPRSEPMGLRLWCRPCGKDGRYCFRGKNRYLCMTGLKPEPIAIALQRWPSPTPEPVELSR